MGHRMRRLLPSRSEILIFATLAAALAVQLGFALSLESGERAAVSATHGVVPVAQLRTHSPLVATTTAAVTALPEVPEGAKLLAIGTALFGLAGAMRRSSRRA